MRVKCCAPLEVVKSLRDHQPVLLQTDPDKPFTCTWLHAVNAFEVRVVVEHADRYWRVIQCVKFLTLDLTPRYQFKDLKTGKSGHWRQTELGAFESAWIALTGDDFVHRTDQPLYTGITSDAVAAIVKADREYVLGVEETKPAELVKVVLTPHNYDEDIRAKLATIPSKPGDRPPIRIKIGGADFTPPTESAKRMMKKAVTVDDTLTKTKTETETRRLVIDLVEEEDDDDEPPSSSKKKKKQRTTVEEPSPSLTYPVVAIRTFPPRVQVPTTPTPPHEDPTPTSTDTDADFPILKGLPNPPFQLLPRMSSDLPMALIQQIHLMGLSRGPHPTHKHA